MRNRTMCLSMVLLSSSLLFTIPTATMTPLANNIKEEANVDIMVHKDRFGLVINPVQEQFEKDRIELEKKKGEELKLQKEKGLKEQKKEPQWQEFVLTFYTSLDNENGYGAVTCQQKPLSRGMVANNIHSLGTQIYLEEYGIRTVADHGGENFNVYHRLDVFVARRDGESDYQYKKRTLSYGEKHVQGYIIK